jgi:hypothetical protein
MSWLKGGLNMEFRKLALIATASMAFCVPASANTLTFQGVTFESLAVDSNTLQLSITDALSGGTGNWANVNYLKAFEIKGIGDVTSASLSGWIATADNGLSANVGCTTGGTPGACFISTPAVSLTDSMVFVIDFVGNNLNFDAPHLKVQFLTGINDTKATGDLLSQTLPIPEPEIYAMLGIGFGLLGWVGRRKKLQAATA